MASTLTVVSAAAATNVPAGSAPNTVAGSPAVAAPSGPAVSAPRADSRVSRGDRTAIAGSISGARAASAGAVTAGVDTEAVVTWALPVAAPNVSSCFGYRGGENHQGADLPKPLGTPIYAVGAGRVVAAGPASGFGYRIVIEHADGVTSTYGHMRYWDVEVGQQVRAGQQIAVVGNEGQSTGPHVHVEIRTQGQTVDPSTFLRARGVELGSA